VLGHKEARQNRKSSAGAAGRVFDQRDFFIEVAVEFVDEGVRLAVGAGSHYPVSAERMQSPKKDFSDQGIRVRKIVRDAGTRGQLCWQIRSTPAMMVAATDRRVHYADCSCVLSCW
jgi:hypothetical protein